MSSVNVTNITDVQINFQSGRMSCTVPTGTVEVVIFAHCDWGQAKVIDDRAFKNNTTKPWPQ